MAGHDHRDVLYPAVIHGVRVIANVNDGWFFFVERGLDLSCKYNELVVVTEPFGDETSRAAKFSEPRLRRDQFGRNSGIVETLQHHRPETPHALLPIGRIITDQQNHCCVQRLSRARECDLRKPIGAGAVLPRTDPRSEAQLQTNQGLAAG